MLVKSLAEAHKCPQIVCFTKCAVSCSCICHLCTRYRWV